MLRNIAAMRERMTRFGVTLRPHLKTAKSARVAALATADQPGGITVSTLREAAYFFQHGFQNLLYAVGITPSKLDRVSALQAQGAKMTIITDNAPVARIIGERAQRTRQRFQVMIEVDSGGRRAGVLPESEELLEIGYLLHRPPVVELAGVLTHAGHAYHCRNVAEVKAVAKQEREGIVLAAERLRSSGLPCPVVSAGSTPTAVHAEDLSGVTEMRPGVYVFFDLDQLAIGACRRENLALSVLASVIGHNVHAGHLLIDAGALALSKDISVHEFRPEVGYGEVCDPATGVSLAGLFVRDVHQEHGMIPVTERSWFERLPVGAKVRILPNHACITAAAYDRYHVLEGETIVDEWDRINGW